MGKMLLTCTKGSIVNKSSLNLFKQLSWVISLQKKLLNSRRIL